MAKISLGNSARATSPQINYIEILANDLTFSLKQRQAHIREIVGHSVAFLDELTVSEASKVIEKFQEWKERGKEDNGNFR